MRVDHLLTTFVAITLRRTDPGNTKTQKTAVCIGLAVLTALTGGCAAPTHKPAKTTPTFPKGKAQAQKTPGFLLGGNGVDLGIALNCSTQNRCQLFGQTLKSFSPSADLLAVGATPEGRVRWSRRYGGKHAETLSSVSPTPDGGALLAGSTQSDLLHPAASEKGPLPAHPLLVRINARGRPLWGATVKTGLKRILDTARTPDGGLVLAGYGKNQKSRTINAAVLKLSQQGRLLWAYSYNIGANATANGVAVGPNGQLLVVGGAVDGGHKPRAFSLSLGRSGQTVNSLFYSGRYNLYFARRSGGHFLVGGQGKPERGRLLAARMNSAGQPQWAYTYTAPGPVTPLDMISYGQSGFLFTGRTPAHHQREQGIVAQFNLQGKPVADLQVGGQGVVEFLSASALAPAHYLLWGDTTLFGAKRIDMLGVQWSPDPGIGSDFKRKKIDLAPHKAVVRRTTLSLDYESLQADEIPTSAIKLR